MKSRVMRHADLTHCVLNTYEIIFPTTISLSFSSNVTEYVKIFSSHNIKCKLMNSHAIILRPMADGILQTERRTMTPQ
jgi:hypothetical protein